MCTFLLSLGLHFQNTIRMWTISFIFCTIGSGINMLLSLRRPSIVITSIVAQLLSFPVGKAWGNFMPAWEVTAFGKRLQLNPGPFNMKEHCLIVVRLCCRKPADIGRGKCELWWRCGVCDRYYSRSKGVLRTRLRRLVFLSTSDFDTMYWLCLCWYHETLSCLACGNVMALEPH